uniref:Type III effector HopAW1 n=1 Tax=Pseudomonas savastanoi pv. phaseolicola TaxID=319 RepID=Q9RBW1_PSESH|nr:unknown [Pseudomonas savastanoi pv. phaseolicola]
MRVSNTLQPAVEHTTQATIGGCSSSTASRIKEIPFKQADELARVGDQRAACVVLTAAWLDRVHHHSQPAEARIDHMRPWNKLLSVSRRTVIMK